MLIFDLKVIGNKLYEIRTKKLLSRTEVAEKAELSDRTYADIERGNTTMRLDTLLKICRALNITPNEFLVDPVTEPMDLSQLEARLKTCSENEKQALSEFLNTYFHLLGK